MFTYEVTQSTAQKIQDFSSILPGGTEVFVPHLPTEDDPPIETVVKLLNEKMKPVPHVVLRNYENLEKLQEYVLDISLLGLDKILILSGGRKNAKGNLYSVLDTNLTEINFFNIKTICLPGFPEGNLDNSTIESLEFLKEKLKIFETTFDCEIITQFCLKPEPIINFINLLKQNNIKNKLSIGIIGPTNPLSLAKFIKNIGISNAMSQVSDDIFNKSTQWLTYDPNSLITDLYDKIQNINKFHLYNFGKFEKTIEWANNEMQTLQIRT